jgi:hypothetical protein
MLVGNKADLEESRQVPRELGQAQADRLGIQFMETSAKSDSGVYYYSLTLHHHIYQ